jgi:hypothetical protein
MRNTITKLRVTVDGLAQLANMLSNPKYKGLISAEVLRSIKSLKAGKYWLGQCLREFGENPTEDISNGQELFKDNFEMLWYQNELNHTEKVDWLIMQINKAIQEVMKIKEESTNGAFNIFSQKSNAIKFAIASTNSYNSLHEAKMHLEFELDRIKTY